MVNHCLRAQSLMLLFSMLNLEITQSLKHSALSRCLGICYWALTGCKNTTQSLIGSLAPSHFLAATQVAWVLRLMFLASWILILSATLVTWVLITQLKFLPHQFLHPLTLRCSQLPLSFVSPTFSTSFSPLSPSFLPLFHPPLP